MTWEAQVEQTIQRAGFWFIHVNRVAFWVLAALALLLLLFRLLGLRLFREALAGEGNVLPSPRRLELYAVCALVGLGGAGFQALRPDPYFYSTLARAALVEGDFPAAVRYFEPLAAWGSRDPEIYLGLGASYLRLGRERLAADAFDRALARDPTLVRAHVLRAYVARRMGDRDEAVAHLRRAYELASDAPTREEILRELREVDPLASLP